MNEITKEQTYTERGGGGEEMEETMNWKIKQSEKIEVWTNEGIIIKDERKNKLRRMKGRRNGRKGGEKKKKKQTSGTNKQETCPPDHFRRNLLAWARVFDRIIQGTILYAGTLSVRHRPRRVFTTLERATQTHFFLLFLKDVRVIVLM